MAKRATRWATEKGPAKKITEQDIVDAIKDLLRLKQVFFWKFCPGPFGNQAGISDLIGCYEGRFLAIEVKKPGGRVSPAQKRFIANVRDAGGVAFVAYSVDDVVREMGWQEDFLFST